MMDSALVFCLREKQTASQGDNLDQVASPHRAHWTEVRPALST